MGAWWVGVAWVHMCVPYMGAYTGNGQNGENGQNGKTGKSILARDLILVKTSVFTKISGL